MNKQEILRACFKSPSAANLGSAMLNVLFVRLRFSTRPWLAEGFLKHALPTVETPTLGDRHPVFSFRAATCILVCVVTALVCGCTEKRASPGEPTGGNWQTILVAAKDVAKLPAPPDPKSDQQTKEIDELTAFEKQRTAEKEATVAFWNAGASVRWNEIARDLVAKHRTDAPLSSRVYTLLSVAQYDALVAAWNNKYLFNRPTPEKLASGLRPLSAVSGDPAYPSEQAAVAAASATVLVYLYPNEAEFLERKVIENEESRLVAGLNFRSDISAGDALGRNVGTIVVKYAQRDGSDTVLTNAMPIGENRWFSAPNTEPITPLWGNVKSWLMTSGSQFRAPPPPILGAPDHKAALTEVTQFSNNPTPEQARVGAFWADGPGSYTPPGRWNKIAADLIQAGKFNEIRAARVFALLNIGMFDAGIACFDSKYHYLVMRPSQAGASVTLRLGLPNHPSYPSGHSCFSGAGADVLGYIFPNEKDSLRAKADEAGMSRIYTGIHFRFDKEAGETMGRKVAQLVIERAKADRSP